MVTLRDRLWLWGHEAGSHDGNYNLPRPSRMTPVEGMARQCELGLTWLQSGRIEGMIFLASCICDLEVPAVEWTRDWIRRVGDRILGNRPA